MNWNGVMPAITTAFDAQLEIDHDFTSAHISWLIDNGCTGIITNGSLGEGATLDFDEKLALWQTCVSTLDGRAPVVPAIASLSTNEGIKLAKAAKDAGCAGLMVLPPYVHKGDWREIRNHVSKIIGATDLSCMLYNNPIAYGVDFSAENIAELAEAHENLHAVKESSGDIRRITAIRALLGNRLEISVGLDDALVEGVKAGAVGWVAGLVNALPKESVELFELAKSDDAEKTKKLYDWFLPLLRLDTVPNFVQLIKLVQEAAGMGNPRVRAPRLELTGEELARTKSLIKEALDSRP